ncbi:MAG: hypothetical protein IPM96_04445 [Ignavibacteria bacterium]|nr:hypothetical protein [Ignavibacteria bacterium]
MVSLIQNLSSRLICLPAVFLDIWGQLSGVIDISFREGSRKAFTVTLIFPSRDSEEYSKDDLG